MLSARNRPADAAAGLAAGADRYVTKPFSPLALLSLLEQARPPQASSG
jgi:CheY-like chemotaxis protein